MESTSMNILAHSYSAGKKKGKPSIPLRDLVKAALLSEPSKGMVVSEIYEFVNNRCKEYDLMENRWKINVRNMLTTSVYFQCFARRERDGRRGKCWKFNKDVYELHVQIKGNSGNSACTENQNLAKDNTRIEPSSYASLSNVNTNVNCYPSSHAELQPMYFPQHRDDANTAMPQPASSALLPLHNGHASHRLQLHQSLHLNETDYTTASVSNSILNSESQVGLFDMQQSYSHTTDYTNARHFSSINPATPHNVQECNYSNTTNYRSAAHLNSVSDVALQDVRQSFNSDWTDYTNAVHRKTANRFAPYHMRDSRSFMNSAKAPFTARSLQHDSHAQLCQTSVHYSTQANSPASAQSDSAVLSSSSYLKNGRSSSSNASSQGYSPSDNANLCCMYYQSQLTCPHQQFVSQGTMDYSNGYIN